MVIRKCDRCGKNLEGLSRYSVQDISRHVPGNHFARVHTSYSKESKCYSKTKESWVDYCDLDFCEKCFEKESIYDFVKKIIYKEKTG